MKRHNLSVVQNKKLTASPDRGIFTRLPVLISVIVAAVLSMTLDVAIAECSGIWSAQGKQPHVGDAYTSDAIESPDKQKTVTISEDAVVFQEGNAKSVTLAVPANPALMEIVWSNNSEAFAINVSDASNEGPWKTFIYTLNPKRDAPELIALDTEIISPKVSSAGCKSNSPSNIAFVAWTGESKDAMVVVESPKNAKCTSTNDSAMFRIAGDTGKLLERLTQANLKNSDAKELGCRLQK